MAYQPFASHLMLNLVYTQARTHTRKYIHTAKVFLYNSQNFNEFELICLHTSIAIVSTQLNGFIIAIAQSVGAVEYTEGTTAEGIRPPTNESPV